MRYLFCLLMLTTFCFPQSAEDIAKKTEIKLRSIKSIQADFEQIYYSQTVSTPLIEKGKFYFKKPNWMKWEYKEPEKKIFLHKEGLILFYIPEENQLIRNSITEESQEIEILSLLSGQKGLLDDYVVEFNSFPTENSRIVQIKLLPKQEGEYSFILLEIDEKSLLIRRAIFFDWAGNKSEFCFSRIKTNVSFSLSVFELKIPPGVEIIEHKTN